MPMVMPGQSGWGTTGITWDANGYGTDPKTGNRIDKQGNIAFYANGAPAGAAADTLSGLTGSDVQPSGGVAPNIGYGFPSVGTAKSSGGSSPGGTSGFGTSFSFSGKDPFATDAAAAKLRDEFARMEQQGLNQINEDASARGIFSSGVSSANASDFQTRMKLGLGAGLEDLFNNAAQQQLAFQLEQQRMQQQADLAKQQMYAGMGTYHYGNANQNQQMMQQGQQGATYSSGDGQSNFFGPGGASTSPSASDPRGQGALELARAYYRATGKYGTPSDQEAWASDPNHPWNAGTTYVPAGAYMG